MIALLAAACGGPPPPTGRLLLVSETVAGGEVPAGQPVAWVIGADGTGARALAAPAEGATYPGPPDPRREVALVVTAREGPYGHREQAWLLPLVDGAGPRVALTPAAGAVRNPVWSPDGAWVAFESDTASYRDLYRVRRDGAGVVRLTDAPNGSFEPDISPDGARIVFGTSRDGNAEIYVMGAEGADPKRLTDHPRDDVHPRWAPAGGAIGWISMRSGRARVHTMAADGSGARAVPVDTPDGVEHRDFAWSPDGRSLAIVAVLVEASATWIDVVDAGTGARLAKLDGAGVDEQPTWSPDGAWIAYVEGHGEAGATVVLTTPDGRARRELRAAGPTEWLPRWIGG